MSDQKTAVDSIPVTVKTQGVEIELIKRRLDKAGEVFKDIRDRVGKLESWASSYEKLMKAMSSTYQTHTDAVTQTENRMADMEKRINNKLAELAGILVKFEDRQEAEAQKGKDNANHQG